MRIFFKQVIFFLSTFPFLLIIYKIFSNNLGPEPVKEITSFTGEWTLIFICLTLSMSLLWKDKYQNKLFFYNVKKNISLFYYSFFQTFIFI